MVKSRHLRLISISLSVKTSSQSVFPSICSSQTTEALVAYTNLFQWFATGRGRIQDFGKGGGVGYMFLERGHGFFSYTSIAKTYVEPTYPTCPTCLSDMSCMSWCVLHALACPTCPRPHVLSYMINAPFFSQTLSRERSWSMFGSTGWTSRSRSPRI